MNDNISLFLDLLQRATSTLPAEYFRLSVAGSNMPIFRERVYCYELYHQLRSIWPPAFPFTLSGEVDKSGHPLFRAGLLDHLKPDFLIHTPGYIEGDLIVIEVKPITADGADSTKALVSLNRFANVGAYQLPILLVFGGEEPELASFKQRTLRAAAQVPDARVDRIALWWHDRAGRPATRVAW